MQRNQTKETRNMFAALQTMLLEAMLLCLLIGIVSVIVVK